VPPTSTPQPTNTPAPASLAFTYNSASASQSAVTPGSTETFNASITANRSVSNELVDFEVYDAAGNKVWQTFQSPTSFSGGAAHQFKVAWPVPQGQASGAYTLKIGVFTSAWGFQSWNDSAATFAVGQ